MAESDLPERGETIRQELVAILSAQALTAREAADELGIREHEAVEHLAHLERSLRRQKKRLITRPARCKACGFEFTKRERLARPQRCPACKKERIAAPRFRIETG